ncbi:MAG: aminoacyl-tRNA hydrolase [Acidobacteriota bacterium]|nr:aminoacyl-tRNA hydrolase [Acidobacteriota bacterium]MDE3044416.1 aminoacyl-tRNA hydrolase [Acidobacteriota bacterium]MDE3107308.1 aminoacyl-tRNA hydrolase [Acidobacteriota bacterium]MDE3223725.1 aminoacyl-tRNA hydrolase [Acidobacteriota bacterium]
MTLSRRVSIPAAEIELRVTTSGGPGGQHANRALTKVVASFHVARSTALSASDRAWLLEQVGDVVRASASRFRSQGQNRDAALEQLARRLASALERPAPRRPTAPTRGARERRVDEKKARGRLKAQRRDRDDD